MGDAMRKNNTLLIYLGIIFFININIAQAAPTTYGPTGLIDIPTIDVPRNNQLELGYYHLDSASYDVFALPFFDNMEISGALRDENNKHSLKTLNIKYKIKNEGIVKPGFAVGIDDLEENQGTAAYVVVSKALPFGLRMHSGIGTRRYKDGFIGLETKLIPLSKGGQFPDMSFMVEHIDKKTSYGIRLATARGLQVTAGWRDKEPFWGITYTVP